MGFSNDDTTRQLAKLSFKEQDIKQILEETHATAKIFLNAMKKAVLKKEVANSNGAENNPLLKEIGIIKPEEEIKTSPATEKVKQVPETTEESNTGTEILT